MTYRMTPGGVKLWLMGKSGEPDLEALLEAWRIAQAGRKSERTIQERARNIRQFLAFTGEDPLSITTGAIDRYLGRSGLKQNSRATYYASIKAFCAWLVHERKRRTDPCERMNDTPKREKSIPRPITTDQLVRILSVCNRRRTKMMVLLGAFAGLRVHEIAKVRGDEVDRSHGSLTVTGKGGSTKLIALDESILERLDEWPDDSWWFPSYSKPDEPVTGRGVEFAISSAMRRANVRAVPHQLRHYYGTSLVAAEVNIRIVQDLMRHESILSTQIYTKVTIPQQHAALAKLDSATILARAA